MTTTVKTFKKPGAALRAAGDRPYLRIALAGGEDLYVVGDFESFSSIELISGPIAPVGSQTSPTRIVAGQVTIRHLERLGNANHAVSKAELEGRA
jgi:hypothetical protein